MWATPGGVTNFYQKLAAVPLFFIWLFLSWIIILWGGQLTYALQNTKSLLSEQTKGRGAHRFSQVALGLHVLFRVYENFLAGHAPVDLESLADEVGVPQEALSEVVEVLLERHLLVEDARVPGHFSLGKHPSRIRLDDLVRWLYEKEFPGEVPLLGAGSGVEASGSASDQTLRHPVRALLHRALGGYLAPFEGKTLEQAWEEMGGRSRAMPAAEGARTKEAG